jgi:hypothetical protein
MGPVKGELIIPFASGGHVAMFEIVSLTKVLVLAIRHHCDEDYH